MLLLDEQGINGSDYLTNETSTEITSDSEKRENRLGLAGTIWREDVVLDLEELTNQRPKRGQKGTER